MTEPIEAAIDESSETIAAEAFLEEALAAMAPAAAKFAKSCDRLTTVRPLALH